MQKPLRFNNPFLKKFIAVTTLLRKLKKMIIYIFDNFIFTRYAENFVFNYATFDLCFINEDKERKLFILLRLKFNK